MRVCKGKPGCIIYRLRLEIQGQKNRLICYRAFAGSFFAQYPVTEISQLSRSEFLIHAADVEGLCQGIDENLVKSEQIHLGSNFGR